MELLKMIKHPHPLIYMSGLKSEDLLAMIDFLYYGEANISKENLESFFALAEELRMKGLTGGGEANKEQIKKTPKSKRDPLKKGGWSKTSGTTGKVDR